MLLFQFSYRFSVFPDNFTRIYKKRSKRSVDFKKSYDNLKSGLGNFWEFWKFSENFEFLENFRKHDFSILIEIPLKIEKSCFRKKSSEFSRRIRINCQKWHQNSQKKVIVGTWKLWHLTQDSILNIVEFREITLKATRFPGKRDISHGKRNSFPSNPSYAFSISNIVVIMIDLTPL